MRCIPGTAWNQAICMMCAADGTTGECTGKFHLDPSNTALAFLHYFNLVAVNYQRKTTPQVGLAW
jgi:hypothetical protein